MGGSKITPSVYNGTSDPPVVPGKAVLSQGNYIPGHLNVGADILSRQEEVWRKFSQAEVDQFVS